MPDDGGHEWGDGPPIDNRTGLPYDPRPNPASLSDAATRYTSPWSVPAYLELCERQLVRIADALEALVARPDVLLVPPGVKVEVVRYGTESPGDLTRIREQVQSASVEAEVRAEERGKRIMRDYPRVGLQSQMEPRYGRCLACGAERVALTWDGRLAGHHRGDDPARGYCPAGGDAIAVPD